MIPLQDAFEIVAAAIGNRRVPTETLAVRRAANRILAADQRSRLDLPPFNKAAVDGYAIAEGDSSSEYRLAGIVVAGGQRIDRLEPGTTVKVMTGAPVPSGAARVVMVEQATERDGVVCLEGVGGRINICKKAEDVAVGHTVVASGTRLGPLHIATLISCGIGEVEVARRVKLAIISTGDEIVDSFDDLAPGKIMNTNGPMLSALADRWGMDIVGERVVPDDKAELKAALERALGEADLVALSGGVSAGDFDFVPEVMTDCGLEIRFSRVAVKPGLPTTFATDRDGILFGLPGNPVAVYVMFHLFVLRATTLLSGGVNEAPTRTVRLANDWSRRSGARTEYCPCRIQADGMAERVTYHGSAHLAAVMESDGFLVIPQGVESLPAGAEVTMVTFNEGHS